MFSQLPYASCWLAGFPTSQADIQHLGHCATHSQRNFSSVSWQARTNFPCLVGNVPSVHRDDAKVPRENMLIHFYFSMISAVVLIVLFAVWCKHHTGRCIQIGQWAHTVRLMGDFNHLLCVLCHFCASGSFLSKDRFSTGGGFACLLVCPVNKLQQ